MFERLKDLLVLIVDNAVKPLLYYSNWLKVKKQCNGFEISALAGLKSWTMMVVVGGKGSSCSSGKKNCLKDRYTYPAFTNFGVSKI